MGAQDPRLAVEVEALRAVLEIARAIPASSDPAAVLDRIVERACRLTGTERGALALVSDPAGEPGAAGPRTAVRFVARRGLSAAFPEQMVPRHPRDGTTPAAVASGRPVWSADILDDPAFPLSPETRRAVVAEGYRAVLSVPLLAAGRTLGALVVYRDRPGAFTPDEIDLLGSFAAQAVTALEASRAWADAARRRRAAEALAAVGHVLSRSLEPAEVAQRIADAVRDLLQAEASTLFRLDPVTGALVSLARSGAAADGPDGPGALVVPPGTGLVGLALREGRPILTDDVLADPRVDLPPDLRDRLARTPSRRVLALPLVVEGRALGALAVGQPPARRFDEDDLRVAQAFAGQAAVALDNARLYAESVRRRREAEELARVSRLLTESLDFGAVARRIVEGVLPLFGVGSSGLSLLREDGMLVTIALGGRSARLFEPGHVMPAGQGVMGRVLAEGRPVSSRDRLQDPTIVLGPELRARLEHSGNRAMLGVPLRLKGELKGVLSIADTEPREFTAAEVQLLEAFADQAAIALENSRLYGELETALRSLEQSRERAVQGERLRALGELAGGVAHDFNNILAVVLGRAQLLLKGAADPEVRRHAEVIEQMALDGARTVRRIQEFARTRRARAFRPVDLARLVEEVAEVTRSRWRDQAQAEGRTYHVAVDARPVPPIAGDPVELREALANLVFNALDAMPDGGRLTLGTRADGERVACEVGDTGVGMTPEVRRRAFDPFFTTKSDRQSGLGLSLVYGIVRRHGGEVEVDSAPGQGSRFTLLFPVAPPAAEPPPAAPPARSAAPARILLIDDELDVRTVLGEVLGGLGHAVTACGDGASGLARLEAEPFDLVITDLGMPGLSGWEVTRRAKAARPRTPVALLTGWGEQIDPAEARGRGVDFLLPKPCPLDDLAAVVARAQSLP
jgi:GAF domain-containing protein